jgi:tripartite-type tricarboxylate transporter receptor subunit TctC
MTPRLLLKYASNRWLAECLAQQVTIEARPGAGSNIAAEAVVRSPPDGYTLLMASNANAINATLYDKLDFDFLRDIALVAGVARVPLVMVVNPLFPATTVPDFVAYAKASPGKINMASAGNGTPPHLAGELFQMMTGVSLTTDLLGGQVQVTFSTMPPTIEYVRAGKLRALAVTTATRSRALPETPLLGDYVPGFEASASVGVGVPRSTPAEIIDRLNNEINAMLQIPRRRYGLPTWAPRCSRFRPPISASSSRRKPRNGAR